jgi:hypothetical protein
VKPAGDGFVALTLLTLIALAFGGEAKSGEAKPTASVYPSGPSVPENLLRIELRFSAPLASPVGIDHIKLLGSDGREIERAFLDLPLPSADGKRETLLMAPVRVKSGLSENLALGRALHVGSTVTLVVDAPELAGPIRRTWRVTGFDVDPPQPGLWTLDLPTRGTRQALLVHLHAPLSSTAEAFIAIRGPNGHRVAGVGRLADGETLWQFTPTAVWEVGRYAVVTHPELEDPAGNRPCGLFEALAASRVRCAGTVQAFQAVAAKEKS